MKQIPHCVRDAIRFIQTCPADRPDKTAAASSGCMVKVRNRRPSARGIGCAECLR
jgi:hypothetical protein